MRIEKHPPPSADLVWIGNWGDGKRPAQLSEFVFEPVQHLGLQAQVYGVRYLQAALAAAFVIPSRYLPMNGK